MLEKQLSGIGMPCKSRVVQRGSAVLVLCVHIRAMFQK
jgi:hypothetical protein